MGSEGLGGFTEAQIERFRREMTDALRRADTRIRDALARAHVDGDGALVKDAFNLDLTRALGEQVAGILGDAAGPLASEFRDVVAELVGRVGDVLQRQGIGPEFATLGATSIRHQMGGRLDEVIRDAQGQLRHAGDAVRDRLRDVVVRSLREADTPRAAVSSLSDAVGATVGRTLALVDTTLAGTDRAATVDFAERAGVEWFAYVGPDDTLARDDCKRWVGHRFTREQIDALESEVGPQPVLVFGGGYRCRHAWLPLVTDEQIAEFPPRRGE